MSTSQELSSGQQARQATVPVRPPTDSAAVPMTGAEVNPQRRTPGGKFASRRTLSRWCAAMLALLTAAMIGLGAAPASAATLGTAWASPFYCDYSYGDTVYLNPPTMTSISGASEYVYWQPDLYIWNGSSWQLYYYGPWYHAKATSYGVSVGLMGFKWFAYDNNAILQQKWGNLPAGYSYAVKNYYQWQNGTQASSWSSYSTGASYCSF